MLKYSITILVAFLLFGYNGYASYAPPGHGHGHGGGHGHSSGHGHSHGGHAHVSHSHVGHSSGHYHERHNSYRGRRQHYIRNSGVTHTHYSNGYMYPLSGHQDFLIGIGSLPANQLIDSAATSATPCAFLTYKYYMGKGFAVGLTAGMQSISGASIYTNNGGTRMPFKYDQFNTSLALELTWLYSSRESFQAYGFAGAGLLHWEEYDHDQDNTSYTESGDKFAFQFTPIGIRVGRSVGAFVELGYGYKGIFHGGISFQPEWIRNHPHLPATF